MQKSKNMEVRATKKIKKDKMTGSIDIFFIYVFEKIAKKNFKKMLLVCIVFVLGIQFISI